MSWIVTPDYLSGRMAVAVVMPCQRPSPRSSGFPPRAREPSSPSGGRPTTCSPYLSSPRTPRRPPGMNGGDSDTGLLLLRPRAGRFEPWSALPAPGGEDAEFFRVGDRSFLAVASIRTGTGPYEFAASRRSSNGDGEVRALPGRATFAAKQWKHWRIGERHFLGLAQGVIRAGDRTTSDSVVYEWTGESFAESSRSRPAGPTTGTPSGSGTSSSSPTPSMPGPASCTTGTARSWGRTRPWPRGSAARSPPSATAGDLPRRRLHRGPDQGAALAAPVHGRPGPRRARRQGTGGRRAAAAGLLLIRINFILGTPADPHPELDSQVYEWDGAASCTRSRRSHVRRHRRRRPEPGRRGRTDRDELPDAGAALRCRDGPLRVSAREPADAGRATFESPELVDLFTTYTASPDSIGAHLARDRHPGKRSTTRCSSSPAPIWRCTPAAVPGRSSSPTGSPAGASRNWPGYPTSAPRSPPSRGCASWPPRQQRAAAGTTAGAPTRRACSPPPKRPARPAQHRYGATRSPSARSRAARNASPR